MVYLKNNQIYYSGYNQYGEISSSTLTKTEGLNNVSQFSSGLDHSLFLVNNRVYSSGLNQSGQLGLGNTVNSATPTLVSNISNVTFVETGYNYSAVLSGAQAYTFGNNDFGQLGQGDTTFRNTPTLVSALLNVTSVACGNYHTLFLSNNQVYSCGIGSMGQLGLGTLINMATPTIVSRLTNIVAISAGGNNSAAIDAVGNLWLWGQDFTSAPILAKSQVTNVNVTLSGIFYVTNNAYSLLKGDLLTFTYTEGPLTLSGSTIPFSVISNICFLADTPITTDQGDISIANIQPHLHTIRGKKIVAITETFSSDKFLIVVEKDAIFEGCPSKKTIMSKEHKIFYQGKMMEAYLFVNGETIYRIPYSDEKLYNVLLEEHGRMKVNNMIVETLDPTNMIGKVFKAIQEAV
jgi:alpha-tubulin suppressor-like RCC1 family protein